MYINITAVLKEPRLPIDYRRLVISLIKSSLMNSDMAAYQRLYGANAPVFKTYSFSVRLSNPEYMADKIILGDNKITILMSTNYMADGITLYNAFLKYKNKPHPLASGNELTIKHVEISNHEPIKTNEIVIKFLSPLVVREHRINAPDRYYVYDDDDFADALNRVVAFQLKSLANITGDEATVKLIPICPDKTVAKALGCKMRCSLGTYRLIANPQVLNTLYQTGMGSRRAAGFGQFEIIR